MDETSERAEDLDGTEDVEWLVCLEEDDAPFAGKSWCLLSLAETCTMRIISRLPTDQSRFPLTVLRRIASVGHVILGDLIASGQIEAGR